MKTTKFFLFIALPFFIFSGCSTLNKAIDKAFDSAFKNIHYAAPDSCEIEVLFSSCKFKKVHNNWPKDLNELKPFSQSLDLFFKNRCQNIEFNNFATDTLSLHYIINHSDSTYSIYKEVFSKCAIVNDSTMYLYMKIMDLKIKYQEGGLTCDDLEFDGELTKKDFMD